MRLGIKIVLVLVRRYSKSFNQHMINISTWYRKMARDAWNTVLYKVLGTAIWPVLLPVTQCRKVVSRWDMYRCNQCERNFEIMLYIIFSPKIVTKTWAIDRGIIEFDHFNAFLKIRLFHANYNIIFIRLTTAVINQ